MPLVGVIECNYEKYSSLASITDCDFKVAPSKVKDPTELGSLSQHRIMVYFLKKSIFSFFKI